MLYCANFTITGRGLMLVSLSWHSPLIWRSSVFSSILKIWPTCFSKLCIQFIKMLTHSRDFKPSVKGSSLFAETSETAELSKLPSRSFFEASSSLELLLKSRFFYILSKYLAISILEYIQLDVNFKYNLYRIYFTIYLWYNNFSRLYNVWLLRYHLRKKINILKIKNFLLLNVMKKCYTFDCIIA